MISIEAVGTYIPQGNISNIARQEKFELKESFIKKKLGVEQVTRIDAGDDTSDMCVKAYNDLVKQTGTTFEDAEVLIVVTQNPDYNIPHTSAIVHGKLGINNSCAAFDISLGCSGYVYSLSVIKGFMQINGFKKGLLFTCDPYSKVIDDDDKNTTLLFGDGAAVTVLSEEGSLGLGEFTFGTIGDKHEFLKCSNGTLHMNGHEIFQFASENVPVDFQKCLEKNNMTKDDIDCFLFHQGSKFIVDTLRKTLDLPKEKVVFGIEKYGNTVSSSIPILLKDYLSDNEKKAILISGFGVGLSFATGILRREV